MEGTLIERAQRGDSSAFATLVAQRIDGLYATAFRILRDRAWAEDVTQEVLLAAWSNISRLRDVDRLDGWLYRLLVNECSTELSRRMRLRRGLRLAAQPELMTVDATLSLAQREQLEGAFRQLSAQHRAVVVFRYYLGWTPSEIAETLRISAGTVSSRLHYALRELRAALAADERLIEEAIGG